MFSQEIVKRIKESSHIEIVAVELGIELKKNKALCPFHAEEHASFSIDPKRQIARCFSCMPRAVDVIGLTMKMKNINFGEAIRFLAQRAGIELAPLTPEEEDAIQRSIRRKEVLEVTTQFYHDQLVKNNYEDSAGYIKDRGFTKELLEAFAIGLANGDGLKEHLRQCGFSQDDGINAGVLTARNDSVEDFFRRRLIFPVRVNGEVVTITARSIVEEAPAKWLHLKGEIRHLYNEAALESAGEILLCEGASDVLMATMHNYKAVGILGALSFKPEYYEKFRGVKQVFICLDADEPGRKGTEQISKVFMGDEKIIELPEGQDLSDYFKAHTRDEFETLKKKAKNWDETLLDVEEPLHIHLMDTDEAKFSDKKVAIDLMICAKGETFHVPKKFTARCEKACKNTMCPINHRTRRITIPENSKDLIDFTRFNDRKILHRLRTLSPCEEDTASRIQINIVERVTVQEILVIPMVSRIEARSEDGKEIDTDEMGREYRDKKVFALTSLPKTNQYFRAIGWVKSSPKTQTATLLVHKLEPINNDYENFQLNEQVIEEFKVFQPGEGESIESKLADVLKDITNNITHIYGAHRERALLCMLLAYCSQIQFKFDDEMLKKGWVEVVIVGDSGQGKTQLYDNLSKAIGLGEFISGTSATRTGISYSYQQTSDTWFLKWGKYPLNDGRLLFIDEGQSLSIDEWNKMSSGRSDGVIRADGVKQGEHPTRTRLIVSCNPKDNRILDDNMCGIETLKYIFRPADIRRFDLPIFLSSSDQSSDIVNIPQDERAVTQQKITPDILRKSVCWAWTRKAGNVVFEKGVVKRICEHATVLLNLYGAAKDIPIVTTDMRHKLARLAVALATFLHSTDQAHQKVVVKIEHVEYIDKFLREIFNHENCCLNVYAELKMDNSTLTDEEFNSFLETMEKEGLALRADGKINLSEDMRLIFLDFANNDAIDRSQLGDTLDLEEDSVTRKLKILKDFKLIRGRSGMRGYRKTPKFNKILRRMLISGFLKREG